MLTVQEWNRQFCALNKLPFDAKQEPNANKAYYLMLIRAKPNYYKNPDDYQTTPVVTPPLTPAITPAPTNRKAELIQTIRSALDELERS